MDWTALISLILNALLGGSFIITLVQLKGKHRESIADAKGKELANISLEMDILFKSVVTPLKAELNEVRLELFRMNDLIKSCPHFRDCPLLDSGSTPRAASMAATSAPPSAPMAAPSAP